MTDLKKNSHAITTGPNRAPARSMLKAVGFTDEVLLKPIVGVACPWFVFGP
jgi:dihydroxy-acid dehydratase